MQRVLKRLFDLFVVIAVVAVAIAASGGASFKPFGTVSISVYSIDKPLFFLVFSLVVRLWLHQSSLAARPDGTPRPVVHRLCRLFGIAPRDSGLAWNPTRVSIWLAGLLFLFLTLSPTYRFLNDGIVTDLAIFSEPLEHAIRGASMESSAHYYMYAPIQEAVAADSTKLHVFTDHYSPFLYLLVPLYWLLPSPLFLFMLQALAIASTVFAVYRIAKIILNDDSWAAGITLLYSLNPMIIASSWHFLPCEFAIAFLVWSFWALVTKRYAAMAVLLLLALSTKEIIALPVISVGAYLFLKEKQRVLGSSVILVAAAWLLLCTYWIVPLYSLSGTYPRSNIYGALGGSISEAIRNVVLHPQLAFPYLFSSQTFKYLGGMLLPVAFLPLLRLDIWLLTLPVLLQNIFIGNPGEKLWFRLPAGQWSAPIVIFTFAAVIHALRDARLKYGEKPMRLVLGGALVASFYLALATAAAPQFWRDPLITEFVSGLHSRIPPGARISSDCPNLLTRHYGRNMVSVFPCGVDRAEYVSITLTPGLDNVKFSPKGEYYARFLKDPRFRQIWSSTDRKGGRSMVLYQRIPEGRTG